jgi:hypothetical protein
MQKQRMKEILVISQQPTTVINETTRNVINQEINQNTRVVIDDDEDNDECPEGYIGKPPFCERDFIDGSYRWRWRWWRRRRRWRRRTN